MFAMIVIISPIFGVAGIVDEMTVRLTTFTVTFIVSL